MTRGSLLLMVVALMVTLTVAQAQDTSRPSAALRPRQAE